MTEEEGKGRKRKQLAGNETGSQQRRGRPRKQRSDEEEEKRHQEKIETDRDARKKKKAFLEMPGIKDIYQHFNEGYKQIHADNLKGAAEQGSKLTTELKQLDERSKDEFIRRCKGLFQEFFEKEGIIEKFEAMWLKVKEEEDRQCREKMDAPRQELLNPEVLEGNLKAGPSNIGSNSEGEWRPSTTTLMTGGVSLSPSDSTDADTEFPCLLRSDSIGPEFRLPSLDPMNADTGFRRLSPLGSMDAGFEFHLSWAACP